MKSKKNSKDEPQMYDLLARWIDNPSSIDEEMFNKLCDRLVEITVHGAEIIFLNTDPHNMQPQAASQASKLKYLFGALAAASINEASKEEKIFICRAARAMIAVMNFIASAAAKCAGAPIPASEACDHQFGPDSSGIEIAISELTGKAVNRN